MSEVGKVLKTVFLFVMVGLVLSGLGYGKLVFAQDAEGVAQSTASSATTPEVNPQYQKAYAEGTAYLEKKDYVNALKMFEAAIKADPNNVSGYISAANAALNSGDNEKAKAFALEAVKLAPDSGYAYFNLASAYEGLNESELAKKNYDLALSNCVSQKCGDDIIKYIRERLAGMK